MNTLPARSLVLLIASLLLGGCVSVTSRKPVGKDPTAIDPAAWNGVWTNEEGDVLHLRVKDGPSGLLEVGHVSIDDDAMVFEKHEVQIRKSAGWLWANIRDEETPAYTFLRVSPPSQHLLVWAPDPAGVVRRIRDGSLKGELLRNGEGKETGSAIIDELPEAQLEAIESGKWSDVFDLGNPGILRRLSRPRQD